MFDCDVLVLGGGPAGLVSAIAARRAGLRVMLADALQPPIDKVCGEGLMPDSIAAVSKLGVEIPFDAGYRFKGIRFEDDAHSVAGEFPNGSGLGVRRTTLHKLLVAAASREGVEFLWGLSATGMESSKVFFARKHISARWIIGADGLHSRVRRWAGLHSFSRSSQRFSYRRHYRVAPWSDYMEIYWSRGCQFYVTPVAANEICVVLMTRNQHQRVADALPQFRSLAESLRNLQPVTPERGAIAATRQLKRVTHQNMALIGDASGAVDPITGQGLCLAFKQAIALANALVAGDLGLYEKEHRRIAARPRLMADFMLLMDRSSLLQKRTMAAFESHPRLFSDLLALHLGELGPASFAATTAALGWAVADSMKLFIMFMAISLPAPSQQVQIELDLSATRVNFALADVLHNVVGTFKLTKGTIWVDPSSGKAGGELVVNGSTGDSGSHARDSRMKNNILQVDLYPEINFTPDRIEGKFNLSGSSEFKLHGLFSIHGRNHELTMNVKTVVKGDRLTASTSFDVPYVDWGMKNPSTLFLRVSGTVLIEIHALGRLSGNANVSQAPQSLRNASVSGL